MWFVYSNLLLAVNRSHPGFIYALRVFTLSGYSGWNHIKCPWNTCWFHQNPDKDKVVYKDKWMNTWIVGWMDGWMYLLTFLQSKLQWRSELSLILSVCKLLRGNYSMRNVMNNYIRMGKEQKKEHKSCFYLWMWKECMVTVIRKKDNTNWESRADLMSRVSKEDKQINNSNESQAGAEVEVFLICFFLLCSKNWPGNNTLVTFSST